MESSDFRSNRMKSAIYPFELVVPLPGEIITNEVLQVGTASVCCIIQNL